MVELKVQLDEIDYSSIAEMALPIMKEKLKGSTVGSMIDNVPASALNGFLKFIPQDKKDEIVIGIVNQYEDRIIRFLEKAAADKGVNVKVKGVSGLKKE